MKIPKLKTVPDIMEWFIHKDRMPEYFEMSDELVDDFEAYGIHDKGYDRFVDYFYILLPDHDKELFDKHKENFKKIHKDRADAMNRLLSESEKEDTDIENRITNPDRDIDSNPIDTSIYYFSDTAYMLKKWHRYKQVYRFHKSLADRLAITNLKGFYPEILDNLPFKSFYIDMSSYKIPVSNDSDNIFLGALVNIIKDTNVSEGVQYILHMILFSQPTNFTWTRFVYHSNMDKVSIKDGFPTGSLMTELGDYIPSFLVNAVIYIASNNADITYTPTKRSKRNPKINPRKMLLENSIKDWSVGYVIGPKIEKALKQYNEEYEQTGTHKSPRPHVRGAHWHHYKIGPRNGEQTLILHWIDETLVNCKDKSELPTTERRSKRVKNF